MSSLSQLSLNNTESVIADSIFLLVNTEIKNIYDIFATISDLDNVSGIDQNTLNILTTIANTIGNNGNWYQDILDALNLKANIANTYSRVYIDNLISNYYTKSVIDGLTGDKAVTKTTVLEFLDVDNIGSNTLSIIGSTNINIKNNTNISLMDFSEFIVEIHPALKCYSTITSIGNLTAPNIYNKTEVDHLLSNLSST